MNSECPRLDTTRCGNLPYDSFNFRDNCCQNVDTGEFFTVELAIGCDEATSTCDGVVFDRSDAFCCYTGLNGWQVLEEECVGVVTIMPNVTVTVGGDEVADFY